MSELRELARSKSKEKMERMTTGDSPSKSIDASGWSPSQVMNSNAQTGMKPISRSKFKRGGKVHGEAAKMHAGRKPRKSGGALTAISLMNRNEKDANEERHGPTLEGGYARGGRTASERVKKMVGGAMRPELQRQGMSQGTPIAGTSGRRMPIMMRAKGGRTEHGKSCDCDRCSGGRVGKKSGGSLGQDVLYGGARPKGDRIARKGGGRASAKKGTTVNVIIAPSQSKPAMPPPGMAMPPPGGGPVGLHQAPPPPQMALGAGAPMGPPASGPPPMMRKRGGRTGYPIDAGAGGGLGRLEKAKAYG